MKRPTFVLNYYDYIKAEKYIKVKSGYQWEFIVKLMKSLEILVYLYWWFIQGFLFYCWLKLFHIFIKGICFYIVDLGFLALLSNFKNELLASFWLLFSQAALQVGGHGERLHQCREVMLLTYKSIPMQVDGEPCRLAPAMIRISLRNQANMVQKSKRRTSMPLLNEWVRPFPTFLNTKRVERTMQSMCMVGASLCWERSKSPGDSSVP